MRGLIDGLETIVRQIDQLTHGLANGVGAQAGEVGEELSSALRSARERLQDVEHDLQHALRRTARKTGRYVRQHPWPAIAIAAVAGFALGALLSSRSTEHGNGAAPGNREVAGN